jgi:DNA-directed RNA polymerase specialized sigma subunit
VFGARLARSPEDETARHELAGEVHAALEEMSDYSAGILRSRHMEERTLEDTGRALGASASEICRDEPAALRQLQAILRRRGLGRRERKAEPPQGRRRACAS